MSNFQRRHYETIATLLKESFEILERANNLDNSMGSEEILEVVTMQFVSLFKTDNDRFNSDRFVTFTMKDRK